MEFIDQPRLQTTASSHLADVCSTSKKRAREALTVTNGDIDAAAMWLLSSEVSENEELQMLGGLSEIEAEQYLQRAFGDLEAAKTLLLSGEYIFQIVTLLWVII